MTDTNFQSRIGTNLTGDSASNLSNEMLADSSLATQRSGPAAGPVPYHVSLRHTGQISHFGGVVNALPC